MPEAQRPGKVLIMIQTDGAENCSGPAYSRERIRDMIKHQRDKYSWDFVFIGTTEKAIADAVEMGVRPTFTVNYAATPEGTGDVMRTMSLGVRNFRSTNKADIDKADYSFSK